MASASQADQSAEGGKTATFASQAAADFRKNVAAGPAPLEEIQDFFLSAGDKIDLSDVAAYFGLTAEDVQDSLCYSELSRGTELGIEVDGALHKIAVVHGVTPAALCKASPWIFDPEEAARYTNTRDRLEKDGTQDDAHHPARVTDEFVFDPAVSLPPPRPVVAHGEDANVAQLAVALGLSEAQVLDALRNKGLSANGEQLIDAETVSSVLSSADALVL